MKDAPCSRPRLDDGGAHEIYTVNVPQLGGDEAWIACRRCGEREKLEAA